MNMLLALYFFFSPMNDVKSNGVKFEQNYQRPGAQYVDDANSLSRGILLGDINGDGEFNLLDVAPFIHLINFGNFDPAGDFNGDGVVNLLDVSLFVEGLSGG